MSGSSNTSWTPFPALQMQTSHSDERRSMPTPSMTSPHPTLTSALTSIHSYNTSPFTRHFPTNDGLYHSPHPASTGHEAHERLYGNPVRLLEAISAEEERCKRKEEGEAFRAESGVQCGQDRAQGPTRKRRAQRKPMKTDKGKGRAESPASPSQLLQSPPAYSYDIHTGNGERAYPTPSNSGVHSPSSQSMPSDHEVESHPHHAYTSLSSYHNAQVSSFACGQRTLPGTSTMHSLNVPDAGVPPTRTGQAWSSVAGPSRPRRNGRRPTGPYPTANTESRKRYYLGTEDNITIITNRPAFHQKLSQHVQLAKNSHHEVMCRIDGCGVIIRGTRKIFETHLNDNHPPAKICTWIDEESGPCRQEQSEPPLQKRHIIDIHCRVWNSDCPECGQSFSRNDAATIKRHNCPERTCWKCREVLASKPAYAAHARKCNAAGFPGPSNAGGREQDEDPAVGLPMGTEDVVDETLQAPTFVAESANPFAEDVSLTSTPDPTPAPTAWYIGTSDFVGHLTAQLIDAFPDRPNSSEESSSSTQTLTPSLVPDGGVLAPARQAGFDPCHDVLGSSTSSMPAFMSPQPPYYENYFPSVHDGAEKYSLEGILGIPTYPEWDASHSML